MTAPHTPPTDRPIHPCFEASARHTHGRLHLPVAPRCNVQCNFCNRRYDCVNESRPGVTSSILTPHQALWYVERMVERDPALSVIGIAGPGDPFANAERTMATLRMVHARFPQLALCVSTNGLELAPHIPELAALGLRHITITVLAATYATAGQLYRWIRTEQGIEVGTAAGSLMLERQRAAIAACAAAGMTIKVNCVVVPGINDHEVEEVARNAAAWGGSMFNLIPFVPAAGSAFGDIPPMPAEQVAALRTAAEAHLPQMRHCARCRADAAGLIGCSNHPDTVSLMQEAATMEPEHDSTGHPYVAVASMEGVLVNLHLGHCRKFLIYAPEDDCFRLVDVREAPEPDTPDRWQALAAVLHDCRAVVATDAGGPPQRTLAEHGIRTYGTEGMIADVLEAVFAGRESELRPPVCRSKNCSGGCSGAGGMCA
ncbi:MAG: NifB/NifX family molybdenum-iron cluster-binding protein [Planctomycetota bacterium]